VLLFEEYAKYVQLKTNYFEWSTKKEEQGLHALMVQPTSSIYFTKLDNFFNYNISRSRM